MCMLICGWQYVSPDASLLSGVHRQEGLQLPGGVDSHHLEVPWHEILKKRKEVRYVV